MFTKKRLVLYTVILFGLIAVSAATRAVLIKARNNNTEPTDYSRIIRYRDEGKGYVAAQEAARLYFDSIRFGRVTPEQKLVLANVLLDNDRGYLARQIVDALSEADFDVPSKQCDYILEKAKVYVRRYHYDMATSLVSDVRSRHICDSYSTQFENILASTSTAEVEATSESDGIVAALNNLQISALFTQIESTGDEVKQKQLINSLISIEPDNASLYIDIGLLFYPTKEYGTMLTYTRKATEIDPYYNRAWNSYCLALLGPSLNSDNPILPQVEEGIAACKQAIALDPEYPRPHNNLGLLYVAKRDYVTAEQEYKKAIELGNIATGSTYSAKPMYNLAEMYYFDLRRDDEALDLYNKVLELQPNFTLAHYKRGRILMKVKHNYADALKDFLFVLSSDDMDSQMESNTLSSIVDCYGLLNQPDYVILYAKRMIEKSLSVSHSYMVMGWAYKIKGMLPEANAAIQKCIDIDGCPDLPRKH